jgi:hypothetical protein
MASVVINSLKAMTISLGWIFKLESFGFETTKYGGKLSLGPPLGGTILAQPCICMLLTIASKPISPVDNIAYFLIVCKLN